MVAAAGDVGSLSPYRGIACLAIVGIGLIAHRLDVATDNATWPGKDGQATGSARRACAHDRAKPRLHGSAGGRGVRLRSTTPTICGISRTHNRAATRWQVLRTDQPAALSFWYRQSPHPLIAAASELETIGEVTREEPPPTVPGMVSVLIDQAGRLTSLTAAPSQIDEPAADARQPDWTALFVEAGLPIAEFSPARPTRVPSAYADARGRRGRASTPIGLRSGFALKRQRPAVAPRISRSSRRGHRRNAWSRHVSPPG